MSSTLTFSNKALPSQFGFNYPILVLMLQMILMQVVLLLLAAFGVIKYPKINTAGLLLHVPVSFLYCLNATLALASLQAVSIPTCKWANKIGVLKEERELERRIGAENEVVVRFRPLLAAVMRR